MESLENAADYDSTWRSETNWSIAAGSLANTVTFESSLSLIHGDNDGDNGQSSSDADSTAKSPLILYPPSPDSAPCEITITFAQKHEVRQVYIRSTARVYEIYLAPELQNDVEYLCTVRCGVADRDDPVLRALDIQEAVLALQKGSRDLAEENLGNENNLTTNEDDWVEVKVLESSIPANKSSSVSSKADKKTERSSQDLYEATAEITDANPCMSLTLRLLSLQNKGCICVDEVYVFADPADATGLDGQVAPVENPSGSSLMAMLVPTFLHLSKTKDVARAQDKYNIDARENDKLENVVLKAADPNIVPNQIQQDGISGAAVRPEVKLKEAVVPPAKSVQQGIPSQILDTTSKPDTSSSHIEAVLNQLFWRVSRIEELMLRFEENMLKPVSNIDERLHHVEQQLEVLTKKTRTSELLSCTRISAPEFSCSGSESNSFYNSGSMDLSFVPREANKDIDSDVSSIPPDSAPVSASTVTFHPSLVVTAPDFSNCDDEEENAMEPVKESPKDLQKQGMSIDDALASALTGFLSSTSDLAQKYSQTLAVKAPEFQNEEEFPNEEENHTDKTASARVDSKITVDSSLCTSDPDDVERLRTSCSSLSIITPFVKEENAMTFSNDNNYLEMSDGIEEQSQHSEGQDPCIDREVTATMPNIGRFDSDQIVVDNENGKDADKISDISVPEKTDNVEQVSANQTDDDSDTTQGGAIMNELNSSTEVKEQSKGTMQDLIKFSCEASVLDFETPILDVKFVSQEALNTETPLEALLGCLLDSNTEVTSVKEPANDGTQINEQCNLISVEDWETSGSGTDTHIAVDMNYCSLTNMPTKLESEQTPDECDAYSNQETSSVSLI